MFGLGAAEIFVIGVLALVLIGPKKLPDLARSLGKSFREFQRAKDDFMNQVHQPEDVNSSKQIAHQTTVDSTKVVDASSTAQVDKPEVSEVIEQKKS